MTDGDDGDELDWLAAQFEPTGQIPKQKEPAPEPEPEAEPDADPAPAPPPAAEPVVPPAPRPPYQPPPIVPRTTSASAPPPVVVPPPSTPPSKPIDPRGLILPTAAVAQTPPPAVVPPVVPPPAVVPPVVPPPAVVPDVVPPAAPAAGGFEWGLRPSDPATASDQPAEPPVAAATVPPPVAAPAPPPESEATVLMPIAASTPPPTPDEPEESDATQLMDRVEPEPTQLILPPIESYGVSAAATELIGASIDESPEVSAESGIDALFGESSFREYEEGLLVAQATFPTRERSRDRGPRAADEPPTGFGRPQKILLIVAGVLVGVLVLIALFLLGTRIPGWLNAEPVATTTPLPSASPTPEAGPVAPGTHRWTELRGGECLDPYTTPWADEFTVVDCAAAHPAQLVARGDLTVGADGAATPGPFPGADALAAQTTAKCRAPGAVNLAAAATYADLVIAGTYPATQEQWDKDGPIYSCFVSRSSGGPITGSLATAPIAAPSPSPSA